MTKEAKRKYNRYMRQIRKWKAVYLLAQRRARLQNHYEVRLEVAEYIPLGPFLLDQYEHIWTDLLMGYQFRVVRVPKQSTDARIFHQSWWHAGKLECRIELRLPEQYALKIPPGFYDNTPSVPEGIAYVNSLFQHS